MKKLKCKRAAKSAFPEADGVPCLFLKRGSENEESFEKSPSEKISWIKCRELQVISRKAHQPYFT